MSTPTVRTSLLAEFSTLSALSVFNLSDYVTVSDLPDAAECLLVEFTSSSEEIRTIGDPNTLGFEENGTVSIHWLVPTMGQASTDPLNRAEAFRLALRARRINEILIESITPFADAGSPIDLNGRFTCFSAVLFYSLDNF